MIYTYFLIRDIWRSRAQWGHEVAMWWRNKKQVAKLYLAAHRAGITPNPYDKEPE
jgi:hypothetical protein